MIVGVCFSQMSTIFAEDLAAICISGMSIIVRCLQDES